MMEIDNNMNEKYFIDYYNSLSIKEQKDLLYTIMNNKIKTNDKYIEGLTQLIETTQRHKYLKYKLLLSKLELEYEKLNNCAVRIENGTHQEYYFDKTGILTLLDDISINGKLTDEVLCVVGQFCDSIIDTFKPLLHNDNNNVNIQGIKELDNLIRDLILNKEYIST